MPGTVTTDPLDAYVNAGKRIRESDLTIAVMGIDRNYEREGQDRASIELPQEQANFLKLASEVNHRLVVVFVAGSPLVDTWAAENIHAMLYAWYPGEQGGTAVVDALFGDYTPAGRLPITFYRSTADLPAFDDYDLSHGRTYMYYEQQPLYPFGHGLSYTTFEYANLELNQANDTLHVSFDVTNTGTRVGDEVPQVYLRYPSLRRPLPIKQLHGFERIATQPGQTQQVNIPVALADLRLWDDSESKFITPQGDYAVMVGASSQDIRLQSMFHLGDQSGVITEIEGVTVDAMGNQLRVSSMDHPASIVVYTPDGRKVISQAHLLGTQLWALDAGIYVIVVTDGHHPARAFKVLIN